MNALYLLFRVKSTRLHTVVNVECHRKAEKFRHVYCALDTSHLRISGSIGPYELDWTGVSHAIRHQITFIAVHSAQILRCLLIDLWHGNGGETSGRSTAILIGIRLSGLALPLICSLAKNVTMGLSLMVLLVLGLDGHADESIAHTRS